MGDLGRYVLTNKDSYFCLGQQQTSAQMQTESDLYRQSQEEIVPIVDYIPLPEEMQMGGSSRWRMKEHLDESRMKTQTLHFSLQGVQPMSSLRIESRVNTESGGECDKKTTSIMQGQSANTIPSNQISINIIKHNLNSCIAYSQRVELKNDQSRITNNQIYSRNTAAQRLRGRSKQTETSFYYKNERSKLLRSIDKSLDEHKTPEKQRFVLRECKSERKKLLNEILDKLDSSIKKKKDIQFVKSNFKESEASLAEKNSVQRQKQGNFNKKAKKWVQTKNALKFAVNQSTQKCLSNSKLIQQHQILPNSVSQWKPVVAQPQFQTPTLIPHPDIALPQTPESSLYTAHKQFPSRRDDQIFTFSNLQGLPFQKHMKNVSISVSQSSSKEFIAFPQNQSWVGECTLCRVIGKRCSFH